MASTLDNTLRALAAIEANLDKLDRLWAEIRNLIPDGIVFGSPDEGRYEECRLNFGEIVKAIPKIDGWEIKNGVFELREIAQMRLDAKEVDDAHAHAAVEDSIFATEASLREYRRRFNRTRRHTIRAAAERQIEVIDGLLAKIGRNVSDRKKSGTSLDGPVWESLRDHVTQLQTLLGKWTPTRSVWSDFHRHLGFAQVCDFRDITTKEWPFLRDEIMGRLVHEDEPVPVTVTDLAQLGPASATGSVSTRLNWKKLDDEEFERLIFRMISQTVGYETPQWLTRTNAADRGRDLSVSRVFHDPLTGPIRSRVIFQCKHWLSKSVAPAEITTARDMMRLHEPPRVDVLVVATTGRFTTAAVELVEKHNQDDKALRIEMWPDSHLELLLAARPGLVAEFDLR